MQGGDKLLMRLKRAISAAVLDIFVGLGQSGINNAALSRSIVVIGGGKLGAVNHQLGGQHNLAPLNRSLDEIPFSYTNGGAETARERHLALAVNFNECGHDCEVYSSGSRKV